MKKLFLLSVVACVILTACGRQKDIAIAFPSLASEPSSTIVSAATLTPTKLQSTEPPPTSTITPFPAHQNKQVVFDYYVLGNHADSDVFIDPDSCCSVTKLVLYDDGQMIIAGGTETYGQKLLSPEEIKQFLSKLEALDFDSLESNQKHDLTDKLYDYGSNYQESFDGLKDCILVNANRSRNLCVYEPDIQFLIPRMKNILKYLDEYKPAGMTPYYPDRLLLTIQIADSSVDNPPAIPWNERFPSLDPSNPSRYVSDTSNQVYILMATWLKKSICFLKAQIQKWFRKMAKNILCMFVCYYLTKR